MASEECEDASSNPRCPYLTVINECHDSIDRIQKALIGDDFQGGLVAKVKEIKGKIAVQESSRIHKASSHSCLRISLNGWSNVPSSSSTLTWVTTS